LEQLGKIWDGFIDFLKTYDFHKVTKVVSDLKWEEELTNPYVWVIGLSIVGYLLVKKRVKALILLVSLGVFLYLLGITLPSSGEAIPFEKLMTFIGGSVVLAVVNLYFLFMRGD
jgi:hypothetical protein